MQINNSHSVLHAISAQGGVYMFGSMLPIWAVIVIEFCCAYFFECVIGSPLSFKMACKMFDPRKNHPIFSCMDVLSILYWIQYFHAFCKCNKVNMFKFPICFLLTNFFHPTYCEMGIWKTFCKGHCCPKLARIAGTSAE